MNPSAVLKSSILVWIPWIQQFGESWCSDVLFSKHNSSQQQFSLGGWVACHYWELSTASFNYQRVNVRQQWTSQEWTRNWLLACAYQLPFMGNNHIKPGKNWCTIPQKIYGSLSASFFNSELGFPFILLLSPWTKKDIYYITYAITVINTYGKQ